MGKRIPTLLGILMLVGLVSVLGVATNSVSKITTFFSQAESNVSPSGVGIANVSDIGFDVYWTTSQEAAGAVFFGKTSSLSSGVAVDDRDLTLPNGKYFTHYVRVSGLTPVTKYFFKISNNGTQFGDSSKGGAPFEVSTYKVGVKGAAIEPIFGKVMDGFGKVISGVIVVWETDGFGKVASISKSDGSFVLPVGGSRSLSTSGEYFSGAIGTLETISFDGGTIGEATVSCQLGKDKPLPDVKLGDNIDCNKIGVSTKTNSFKSTQISQTFSINIVEGETLSSSLPTFSGKAGANQIVSILVESAPISGTVKADPAGNWSWTPPSNLEPGTHTVTISVTAADGTIQKIKRSFLIPSGQGILPVTTGTPSAQLSYFSCVNQACTKVLGEGTDSCVFDSDCATVVSPPPDTSPKQPYSAGVVENTILVGGIGLGMTILAVALKLLF